MAVKDIAHSHGCYRLIDGNRTTSPRVSALDNPIAVKSHLTLSCLMASDNRRYGATPMSRDELNRLHGELLESIIKET